MHLEILKLIYFKHLLKIFLAIYCELKKVPNLKNHLMISSEKFDLEKGLDDSEIVSSTVHPKQVK